MRIALVKLSSIGDVVHALPVAAALRAGLPQARLTWFVERREAAVLRGNAALSEIDKNARDATQQIRKAIEEYAVECSIIKVWGSEMLDYVVDETLTLIRMRLGIAAAEAWWAQVEGSTRVRHEMIDTIRAEKARAFFFRHRDKAYSFTDCTSFTVMREMRLTQALTTDRHFRQMGFQVIPATRGRAPRR